MHFCIIGVTLISNETEKGNIMLILTRKVQEAIIINDNISVRILSIAGSQVRLGIEAPREVEVHREEIYHTIQNEKDGNRGNI